MNDTATLQDKYYDRIKTLNVEHYGGEVSYYSIADFRPAEKELLSKLPKGASILDVGCGSGRFSINAAKLGFNVTGIDITPKAIQACKIRAKKEGLSNAKFLVMDITSANEIGKFDYVFCPRFVINAIATKEKRSNAISNMYNSCKSSGSIFIESFNILYMGRGPKAPFINILKSIYRNLKIRVHILTKKPYEGLFPGDITYPANKAKGASDGYAHLPTILEVKGYLKNGKTQSIHEILNKRKDYLKPFRYSIWIIEDNIS